MRNCFIFLHRPSYLKQSINQYSETGVYSRDIFPAPHSPVNNGVTKCGPRLAIWSMDKMFGPTKKKKKMLTMEKKILTLEYLY